MHTIVCSEEIFRWLMHMNAHLLTHKMEVIFFVGHLAAGQSS